MKACNLFSISISLWTSSQRPFLHLKLTGHEQQEDRTMLLWLQNRIERGTRNQTFVDRCLEWLERFPTQVSPPLQVIAVEHGCR